MQGKLITREALLAQGLGGDRRRAETVLALIEARAWDAKINRTQINAPYRTEAAFAAGPSAYLSAIAGRDDRPVTVSIRDIERSTGGWADIIPDRPEIRAGVARLLGQKYKFAARHIPATSAALGLDDTAVARAFGDAFLAPLDSIFATGLGPWADIKWRWARLSSALEALPPFWTAFALTLTEIVGAGTLALPIALATIGPLAGAAVLLVVGLINVLTVAYLAEASARNANILYGSAFVGKLVRDFLGPLASCVVRAGLFMFCCTVLVAYYTGFSGTLAAFSGLPAPGWAVLMFAITVFAVLRRSIVGTVSSALMIGMINISILVLLSGIALLHFDARNLAPGQNAFQAGAAFDPSLLQLIFGVVMTAYFGHVSVSNCAQAVLRREPGGRALITGTVTAMFVAIAIYILWSVSIGSAIAPDRLAREDGTALIPLAEIGGPVVAVLGTIFVVLALGMASVHFSLGIFNIGREAMSAVAGNTSRQASIVAVVPLIGIFAFVQMSFATDTASFIKPLELQGALLTPIIATLLPAMLVMAGRRRGQSVGRARLPTVLAHPLTVTAVGALAIGSLVIHATVIWTDPLPRMLAGGAILVCLWLLLVSLHRRDFRPGLYIRATRAPGAPLDVEATANGHPVAVHVAEHSEDRVLLSLEHAVDGLGSAVVVAHHQSSTFDNRPLPGRFDVLDPQDRPLGQARLGRTLTLGDRAIGAVALLPDKTDAHTAGR